jgi:two-component system sensor histidine kinase HydH
MTIRRSLLLAILPFSAVFAALFVVVTYTHSRAALREEIHHSLALQAETVAYQVSTRLRERFRDLEGWRALAVMQEARVGDVDRRLTRFLAENVAHADGAYAALVVRQGARVIAANDPEFMVRNPPPPAPWQRLDQGEGVVTLGEPDPVRQSPLVMSVPIKDDFGGVALGTLEAHLDWADIGRLLDRLAVEGREVAVLDASHRPIALSKRLRHHPEGLPLADFARLPLAASQGVRRVRVNGIRQLLGYATLAGHGGIPALGWQVAVLVPEARVMAPVKSLLASLLLPFALITGAAAWLAIRLSTRAAQPLQALTSYTRAVAHSLDAPPHPAQGPDEVVELTRAFNGMVEDLRRSRIHLVRASKLAAVGEMAAKLAHEVRTPLGIIRSSAQLLDRQTGLDDAGHEMLGFMVNECDRMNALVTGMLEGARNRAPRMDVRDINETVQECAALLRERVETRGNLLLIELDPGPLLVNCDHDQMLQVLLNLVQNANQMLPRDGLIRIRTRRAQGQVFLSVDDSGPGIPEERRLEILEPFVSFRPGGIGLGLAIVREILESHGSVLMLETSDLGGARFAFTLTEATGEAR